MFISTAWAQAAGGGAGTGGIFGSGGLFGSIEGLLPLVLIFGVFYFLLIRPQQKRAKQHRDMLSSLRRGDRVITGGGIYGTVTKVVSDSEVVVQIAEAVKVRVARETITSVLAKTEPTKTEKADKAEKPEKNEKSSGDVAAS
jgi:preprotein translocase subunit YajC